MGLIARGIESRGLATVFVGVMLDIMKVTRPPRSAFVDFPLGHPFGRPFDAAGQRAVLRDVLCLLALAQEPCSLVELPHGWGEPFTFVPGQSRVRSHTGEE